MYKEDVVLFVTANLKQSTREKTIKALELLLSGIGELEYNQLDKMLELPWTQEECNAHIQSALGDYTEIQKSQYIKSVSCGDRYDDFTIRMEKGDTIVDSLIAAGKIEELAVISAKIYLRYFQPEIEKYYNTIQRTQFTFEESHNLRRKINSFEWSIEEIGRYYFDSTYGGLLSRADELYLYDYNPYQLAQGCQEREFAHDLNTYARIDNLCCPTLKKSEKFNTLLGRAIQRKYFNKEMDVANVVVQQIGSLNIVDAQFRVNQGYEYESWFGAFVIGKDGSFQLVEINLPYNHYGERQTLRNLQEDISDDFLVTGNSSLYSDSLITECHLALIGAQTLEWTSISIPALSSLKGASLVLNNIGFNEYNVPVRPLYQIYPTINVAELDTGLLHKLIVEMKSEIKRYVVRDTLPTALKDQIWGVKWLELTKNCFVDLYRFSDLVSENEKVSKIAYRTNLIFDDLDGDSIDEVFNFTVHNGKLVDFIMFAKTKEQISRVSGLKWKKLLKKSDYFINLSHHSMIGRHE
ncbi:MAG: hypothetical protein ACKVOK_11220 [Flavobacteriales bacterium]